MDGLQSDSKNLTKLKSLNLHGNQLTHLKGLEKLKRLKELLLRNNPELTKAQIAEIKKALPDCLISSNPRK
jgi:Leucine-rich repeat (LRR) protein